MRPTLFVFFFFSTVETIFDEMEILKNAYNYVQRRVNNGHMMGNMVSENLTVMISCHYFLKHTSHHDFINRDLREAAREILAARRNPYVPSPDVERLRNLNLLPPLPREDLDPIVEFPLAIPRQVLPERQVPAAQLHLPQEPRLARRRAADFAEIIEVVLDIIE